MPAVMISYSKFPPKALPESLPSGKAFRQPILLLNQACSNVNFGRTLDKITLATMGDI